MRKTVRMTFEKGKISRGFKGYYSMDYYVSNVIDLETNKVICDEYIFRNSTIFKGKGFKFGDIIEMTINVDVDVKSKSIKLSYYKNIHKVIEDKN